MNMYGIDKCPHCGEKDFFVKQSIKGIGQYYMNLDGEEVDNSTLHDGLEYRTIGKYAYCCDCRKRMFKITEDMNI